MSRSYKCAYCGADWRHLILTKIKCTIGRSAGYQICITNGEQWNNLPVERKEEIKIWNGAIGWSDGSENEWKELVQKKGSGDIVFAGRSAFFNLVNCLRLRYLTRDWFMQFVTKPNVLNPSDEKCGRYDYADCYAWLKYGDDRLFDLFLNQSEMYPVSALRFAVIYRLQNGYPQHLLNNRIYDCKRTGTSLINPSLIGHYYLCRMLEPIDDDKSAEECYIYADETFQEDVMRNLYKAKENISRPVVVIDEAIGYNGKQCVRVRYLHMKSTFDLVSLHFLSLDIN